MQGYGNLKMKGKLSHRPACGCCDDVYNGKKLEMYKDNSYLKDNTVIQVKDYAYNGTNEYPVLEKLFGNGLEICCDHPFGEDVVFFNGKYKGYVESWLEYLAIAEHYGLQYDSHDDLYIKVTETWIDNPYQILTR